MWQKYKSAFSSMLCWVDVDTALCYVNVRPNAVSTSSRLMSERGDIHYLNPVMLSRFVSVRESIGGKM